MPRVSQIPPIPQVSFGHDRIPEHEKGARVRDLFDRIAARYDLMNDLMSWRLHRVWRSALIARLAPRDGEHLLDAAGGTGDIGARFLRAGGGQATITDLSRAMLAMGRKKALRTGLAHKMTFLQDDMEHSRLPDQAFQCATCAFGLRNATHPHKALQEIYRTLEFGGRLLVLEFCPNPRLGNNPALVQLYNFWTLNVVPRLGKRVVRDEDAYRYLVESVRGFLPPSSLNDLLQRAGFLRSAYRTLSGGLVALHWGWKV